MARVNINVNARFQAAFGFTARRYFIPDQQPHDIPRYEPATTLAKDESPGVNPLGHPLFDQLTIEAGTTPGNSEEGGQSYEEYKFNVDPIIQINRPKNIKMTDITGREGTVKELIGKGDFKIRIRGIIASLRGGFPADEVQALINLLELDASLEVSSKLLNFYGISNMVVLNYDMPRSAGFPDQQAFDIKAVSDYSDEIYFEEFTR